HAALPISDEFAPVIADHTIPVLLRAGEIYRAKQTLPLRAPVMPRRSLILAISIYPTAHQQRSDRKLPFAREPFREWRLRAPTSFPAPSREQSIQAQPARYGN